MSSLYRLYRPKVFDEVLGQDHITSSLVTSLKKDLVGHAYLFSGPRGTGKTTLARLFARALNCQKRSNGENPCNKCALCLEISDGKSVDVLEIDAASNRGIDEIRELRERVAYAPSQASRKVYIIDEVHMLTKEAFNALLKTLEEPPAHVVFILATTELHKVPETIISRCQRFQFHRASTEAVSGLLADVAKKEKITIDEAGLSALAYRAEGSYRDGLTLLGNLASHGGELDGDAVRKLLGLPPAQFVEETHQLLSEGKTDQLMNNLRTFLAEGGDVVILAKSIADKSRHEVLEPTRSPVSPAAITILEQLLLTLARARTSADPTALVLAGLVSLSLRFQTPNNVRPAPALTDLQKVDKPKIDETPVVDAVLATPTKPPATDDGGFWTRLLDGVKNHNHALYMVVRSAALEGLTEDKVIIAVKFRFYVDRLQETRNRKMIEAVAAEVAGRPLKLECVIRADLDVGLPESEDLVQAVVDVFELEEVK